MPISEGLVLNHESFFIAQNGKLYIAFYIPVYGRINR
jgi:hypothetical protein